mgnify:CR=1 FL=1
MIRPVSPEIGRFGDLGRIADNLMAFVVVVEFDLIVSFCTQRVWRSMQTIVESGNLCICVLKRCPLNEELDGIVECGIYGLWDNMLTFLLWIGSGFKTLGRSANALVGVQIYKTESLRVNNGAIADF